MAYSEEIAASVREILSEHAGFDERKMFGGVAFMVKGHMCCGVLNDDIVLRLGPERALQALKDPNVRPMDFTGRPMKGFVFVGRAGIEKEPVLRRRIQSALDFVESLPPK